MINCKDDRKKTIHCKTIEDDKPIVSESSEDDESPSSDEDINDESKIDIYTSLYQKIENLEKNVLNEDQNKMINENIFYQYGHFLIRTLDKIKM